MDNDRLKHSLSVARKMIEIGKDNNLEEEQLKELFLLGFVHDIGYEFVEDTKDHPKVGGEILKQSGYKYWKEVYYHGRLTNEYKSLYLKILNQADMQIDKTGQDVGYDKRLEDILKRYGKSSNAYIKSKEMIESLKVNSN